MDMETSLNFWLYNHFTFDLYYLLLIFLVFFEQCIQLDIVVYHFPFGFNCSIIFYSMSVFSKMQGFTS